jgi:hypothetical protein
MLRAALFATTVLIWGVAQAGLTQPQCIGDCNGDGAVTVAEVVSGVAIALARSSIDTCPAIDANRDASVSVSELTTAVGFALNGCPPAPTPTATQASCGDPVIVGRFGDCVRSANEAACLDAGGQWGRYQFSGREGCFCPTGQGGCPCASTDDCLSFCIASIPGDVDSCPGVEKGLCTDVSPTAGCFCTPQSTTGGFVALCNDP